MVLLLMVSIAAAVDGDPRNPTSIRLSSAVPVIGAWFPQENEMASPDGYRDFLDAAAEHSPYTLLTTTMRNRQRQMVDEYVHDWFKRAAGYAKDRGMGVVLELDVRHSVPAFMKKYPHALQQRLWLREVDLKKEGTIAADITYTQGHDDAINSPRAISIQLERVYTYSPSPTGAQAGTVKNVTDACKVQKVTASSLSVPIPCTAGTEGRKACVIARVTFNYPDVFSPELLQFEADTIQQYADLPLAGLMIDEWGFPADHIGNPNKNGFWTSRHREDDYAKRTGGRDLVRDSFLMCMGEEGRETERQAAINHYMEQSRYRNSEIEHAVYAQTKAAFGPRAFVGTHDTVFPYPDAREFERNGLNWWTATRDFGQTDEITPYCCRTSLAKKCGGPVWFNQWYSNDIGTYEKKIWSYALTGGRMNFHNIYPCPDKINKDSGKDLLRSTLFRGDSRIRLLNNISDTPLDCPVAVVFGHTNVMNWAGPSFEDIGTQLTDAFWRAGIYADLIPSTEITNGSLRVDDQGQIWYGKQRYEAVVLYRPEFENPTTAEFFQQAAKGKTLLYRIGEWTKDFDARPLDGSVLLPARMKVAADIDSCTKEIIAKLTASGVEAQTPSSGDFPKWNNMGRPSVDMPASGRSRLTDGTVILVAGEEVATGDPIQKTIQVNGHSVTFDAVGVAAVRLDEQGKLEAMAAGGLKYFKTGSVEIRLDQPADVALWKDANGMMQGILQDYQGPVPASLKAITPHWLRLAVPAPLGSTKVDTPLNAKADTTVPAAKDSAEIRLPGDFPPVIGCWFWTAADREPENFKPFIDNVAKHTAYNVLTTSIRIGNRYMTDTDIIDATKKAAAYARTKGIGIAPELGFWASFPKAYPKEPLQMIRLLTANLVDEGEVIVETSYQTEWNHLQGWPFEIGPASVARVYSYVRGKQGVDPKTVEEITSACKVVEVTPGSIRMAILCSEKSRGREACVLFTIPWQWPDPFNPKLPQHHREHLKRYADVGLAGACLDEFGLPAFAKGNELWYSPYWASTYAHRTGGRDLLGDMLLMVVGEKGREGERYGAVNHYMEMTWQQLGKIENNFYEATKETFGPEAFVGTHPTWQPHLNDHEVRRNALDWWVVRRDYGQTDEVTPYCVRTALAKKWGKPVGYNMFYATNMAPYQNELWCTALAGLRVNYHPVNPRKEDGRSWARKPLWSGGLMRGDCRVRMLNFISKTQVDCPVAVIFGHAGAINWAGPTYADAGDSLARAFWETGFYADLIPSSESASSALHVDDDGFVRYGNQKYAAVVLYHPEFEKPGTGNFFKKAAKGKTALYRMGNWTRDFEGAKFDGKAALPSEMTPVADAKSCVDRVTAWLRESGIAPCTPAPAKSGQSRLIDGTVILTAGEKNPAGDSLQKTIRVNGHEVTFDAVGVAAVRLDEQGKLEAMAAGGLKSFQGGGVEIAMPARADVALWKNKNGTWQGILQGYQGAVPENLAILCKNWTRLKIPVPAQ